VEEEAKSMAHTKVKVIVRTDLPAWVKVGQKVKRINDRMTGGGGIGDGWVISEIQNGTGNCDFSAKSEARAAVYSFHVSEAEPIDWKSEPEPIEKETPKHEKVGELADEFGLINQAGLIKMVEKLATKRMKALIDERVSPQKIIVETSRDGIKVEVELGLQHYKFQLPLACIRAGVNVALVGPAGTGKTTTCESIAKALGLDFASTSYCRLTTKADLLGYMDAGGMYHGTGFRKSYEFGGLFCQDEFDAGNENVNVVMNAALSNGSCSFPDGMVKRHKDFVTVACMNTYGSGGNRVYVGRNQLDAATMDRFAVIEWDLDEALESHFANVPKAPKKFELNAGGVPTVEDWLMRVRSVRDAVAKAEVRHIVSPRAVIGGVRLIAQGVGLTHLEEMLLWKGLDAEQRERVVAKVKA
jgi:AAA domain (dynein-related subfamily)